ncbi:MAG: DUF6259 domain-containing protein [Sphingobacterium sp.]|nr:DUF6259 domain-containing protein [Sphingobacterium sp.]
MEIAIDSHNGILREIRYKNKGLVVKNMEPTHNQLWTLSLTDAGQTVELQADDFADFSVQKLSNDSMKLVWQSYKRQAWQSLAVEVDIKMQSATGLSYWNIRVKGLEKKLLNRVIFPAIDGLKPIENGTFAIPHWMGEIMNAPKQHLLASAEKKSQFSWTYPGLLAMQFMTLYDTHGLYMACNDQHMQQKEFSLYHEINQGLTLQIAHTPSLMDRQEYTLPYQVIIGAYQGDWMTASRIYKSWAVEQNWVKQSRLKNGLIPDWIRNTGLWVWNRGKSDQVLAPAMELKDHSDFPISVLWHWWHHGSYDDSFPEYLPPREGVNSFIDHISEAKTKGIHALAYMNALQWGDSTASWLTENAYRYAIKDRQGKPLTHVYNIFTNKPLTNMCVGTKFWRNKYKITAGTLLKDYGISGIYMDQACIQRTCYDPSHGHPIGGGNFWAQFSKQLTEDVRSSTDSPIALSGEGSCEAWIPSLDLFLSLQVSRERYSGVDGWDPIPLFQAVYHEYALSYGSYSSLLMPPYDELWPERYRPSTSDTLAGIYRQQFMLEQARSFVWGMQPMLANYHETLMRSRKPEMDFILRLAKLRYGQLKYLQDGEFYRPPVFVEKQNKMSIAISKLSIYAGQNEHVKTFHKSVNTVLVGAWRSPDGLLGIPIVNIAQGQTSVDFILDAKDYQLPQQGTIYLSRENQKKKIGNYSNGRIEIKVPLAGYDALIIEIG